MQLSIKELTDKSKEHLEFVNKISFDLHDCLKLIKDIEIWSNNKNLDDETKITLIQSRIKSFNEERK
jgi:hypothetical protein|tara:strand:+ start:165 stop:365 length:201 start_codon:yes stop_codon:yes gene_type:complete